MVFASSCKQPSSNLPSMGAECQSDCSENISEKEDFELFISEFYSDTLFTISRIQEPLLVMEIGGGELSDFEEWAPLEFMFYWESIVDAKHSPDFIIEYIKNDDGSTTEFGYIEDSDCYWKATFVIFNRKWYLSNIIICNI